MIQYPQKRRRTPAQRRNGTAGHMMAERIKTRLDRILWEFSRSFSWQCDRAFARLFGIR